MGSVVRPKRPEFGVSPENVPLMINEEGKTVSVGKYRIASPHFTYMAEYVAGGGFLGWGVMIEPHFSKPTLKAIEESRNPVFVETRRQRKAVQN